MYDSKISYNVRESLPFWILVFLFIFYLASVFRKKVDLNQLIMRHYWGCAFWNSIWYNFGNLLYRIGNTMFYCFIKAFARYWQVSMVFIISVDSYCWSNYTYYSFLQKRNRWIEQIWKRSFIRIISIHIKMNKVPYLHDSKELYFLFKNCISF